MRGLAVAAHIGHDRRRTDHHVRDAALATTVVLAVITSEAFHQQPGELDLAAHEDLVPGNKDVLKDGQALAADDAVASIALVDVTIALAVVVGLATEDVDDAGCVHRNGAGHSVVLVLRRHAP